MFKRFILIILLASLNYLECSEFEVKIAYYPKEVIKGEFCNVTATIRNISGGEILIAGGLHKEFIVRRADGEMRKEIIPPLEIIFAKEVEANALPSDFKSDFTEDIFHRYEDEVGEFIVQFRLSTYYSEGWLRRYI